METELIVPVIISCKNGLPCIILRKETTNLELIKKLVNCAWHERNIIIKPVFSQKLQSLNSMVDKGILYVEDGKYFFTF